MELAGPLVEKAAKRRRKKGGKQMRRKRAQAEALKAASDSDSDSDSSETSEPETKRTAVTDSDGDSSSSTPIGSGTDGERQRPFPICGLSDDVCECSVLSDATYSSTNEYSLIEESTSVDSFDLSRHNPSWKLIAASFLDASRATFMYKLARGCLPNQNRPFTAGPARGVCPFCGAREDAVHISQCALPAALRRNIASLFGLPGVPYQTVRFLNPLPSRAINQFVLLVECSYQVWLARWDAVFNERRAGLHEVLAKVRKELWFHLTREWHVLGGKKFLETWHRPAVIFKETGGTITVTF
ncbi:hypothetical protein HPB50_028245 [Hyalomma asiaticum]|nr:hypothetical protein HPB50_028245 [Hyalomma asiaticum]